MRAASMEIQAKPHTCVHSCVTALRALLCRLLRLIAIGLQLPDDFFDPFFDAAISNIRTIRYLPGQHRARDGVFGVGARHPLLLSAPHVVLASPYAPRGLLKNKKLAQS